MKMFYIENVRQGSDCRIFWRPEGKGYTRILEEAWKVTEKQAEKICRSRPEEDKMREAEAMENQAVRHVPR